MTNCIGLAGALVPDDLMVDLVLQDLKDNKGIKRLLLDGYANV